MKKLTDPRRAWYVVQTKPRQEARARDNLANQGVRCVLPLLQVEKIRRRRREWVDEPLFSRYVFIELDDTDAKWNVLHSTRGVSHVVRFGGVPATLPPDWMDSFLARDKLTVPLFEGGQAVTVTNGPFKGMEGVFQMRDGEERAIVMLELLGKPCKGSFPLQALRRVA